MSKSFNNERLQPLWQRIVLLVVLGYEGAGCLAGGGMLMATPDGRSMQMPVELLHGAFPDFFIPGLILFGLGILNTIAFIAVLRRWRNGWVWASVGLGGLAIWFYVEIAILLELHWLHAMWGLPVVAGILASASLFPKEAMRRTLLVCGIASSVLYVAINIIVAAEWPGYSMVTQTPSELSAVGAPTRFLWNVLCTPYTLLVVAFAMGMWKSAAGDKKLRIASVLIFIYGALGLLWPFAPMHLRATLAAGGGTFSDTMHLTLAAVTQLLYLSALVVSAVALQMWFRIYSVITFVVLAVFGALTFIESPNVATNGPTPHIGVWERINIGVFLLWMIVLALILLQKRYGSKN